MYHHDTEGRNPADLDEERDILLSDEEGEPHNGPLRIDEDIINGHIDDNASGDGHPEDLDGPQHEQEAAAPSALLRFTKAVDDVMERETAKRNPPRRQQQIHQEPEEEGELTHEVSECTLPSIVATHYSLRPRAFKPNSIPPFNRAIKSDRVPAIPPADGTSTDVQPTVTTRAGKECVRASTATSGRRVFTGLSKEFFSQGSGQPCPTPPTNHPDTLAKLLGTFHSGLQPLNDRSRVRHTPDVITHPDIPVFGVPSPRDSTLVPTTHPLITSSDSTPVSSSPPLFSQPPGPTFDLSGQNLGQGLCVLGHPGQHLGHSLCVLGHDALGLSIDSHRLSGEAPSLAPSGHH